jgi:hypothetical protein
VKQHGPSGTRCPIRSYQVRVKLLGYIFPPAKLSILRNVEAGERQRGL